MADERHDKRETAAGAHLVPWLRGVPLPPGAPSRPSSPGAAAVSAPAPASASHLPDWLRDLRDTVGDNEPDEPTTDAEPSTEQLPDWLASLASETANEPAPSAPLLTPTHRTGEEGVPDWLRELGTSEPSVPISEQASSRSDAEGVPNWLQDQTIDAATSPTPVEPPTPTEPPVPPPASGRAPMRMPSGTTDWLRSLGQESDAGSSPDSDQPGVPEPPTANEGDDAIPSWLRGISSEDLEQDIQTEVQDAYIAPAPSEVPPSSPPALSTDDDDGIPAWLRDITTDEVDAGLFDVAPEGSADKGSGFQSSDENDFDAPGWLAPEQTSNPAPRDDANIPAWLQSAAPPPLDDDDDQWRSTQRLDANQDDDKGASGGFSDWLEAAASEATARSYPTADQDDSRLEPQAPAWLQGPDEPSSPVVPEQEAANEPALPDWLRDEAADLASEPAAPSQSSPFETRQNEEIPAWLRGDDAPSMPPPAPSSPAGDIQNSDVPDWLRASGTAVPEIPPLPERESGADDLPDWLRMDASSAPGAPSVTGPVQPAPRPSGEDEDLPDWLRMGGSPTSNAPSQPSRVPDTGDVPDWLRMDEPPASPLLGRPDDVLSSSDAPAQEDDWLRSSPDVPTPASGEGSDDLPDWLRSDSRNDSSVPVPPPTNPSLPDWLQGGEMQSGGRDAPLPAWLHGADSDAPARPLPSAEAPAPHTQEAPTLPPWLREEGSAPAENDAQREASGAGGDFLDIGGTDLPGWLRSSETAGASVSAPATSAGETYSDWLARLRTQQDDELDSDVAVAEPDAVASLYQRPTYAVRPERMPAIALLQRLVAEPFPTTAPAPAIEVAPSRRYAGLERALYLLLLLAIIAGLALPSLSAPFQGAIAAPDAQQIGQRIDALGENDVVLVAYEWDVRRRGELAPLEQAVMGHLAQRHVKFVFVSTDLQGTLLSFDMRDRLINQFNYQTRGLDYILLGYKPGGELGLRQMAQNLPRVLASDFQGADANQSAVALDVASGEPRLKSIRDFAMVVVMADDAQDVQGWMEQVRPQMNSETPMVLLMPAETTPVVQPYLQLPGVFGLSGRLGALGYDQQRSGDVATAAQAASGQVPFAIICFVVLALLGGLIGAIIAAVQRRRTT